MDKRPWEIETIPESIFNLKKGDVFRWYQSWGVPKFSFVKIKEGIIHSLDSRNESFTWKLKGSETIYIEKQ